MELGAPGDTVTTAPIDLPPDGRLSLVGLPAGADIPWRVRLVDDDGVLHTTETGWISTDEPPAPLDDLDLDARDPSRSEVAHGHVVLSAFGGDAPGVAALLDGYGRPVWWVQSDGDRRLVRAKLSSDGRHLLWAESEKEQPTERPGALLRQRLDGLQPPEATDAWHLHHDFLEEPDSGWTWLGHTFARVIVDSPPLSPVATDVVWTTPPDSGEPEHRFDYFEDYPPPPWWVCEHMSGARFVDDHHEWTHTNSLLARPSGDGWWLLPRYLDALVHVDGEGRFVSQLGGRDGTWTLGPGAAFSHAHASHAFDDRVLVFDNVAAHGIDDPPASRVIELRLDEDARHAELVWELPNPDGWRAGILGDARRLPGGNTLVAWGEDGRITEHTPDGDIVWELRVPAIVARVSFVPALSGAPTEPVELP